MTLRRVRVVAALIQRDEAVLVQQRGPEGPRGLLWEFPGGKVEPGESDSAALARECLEELGVEVSVAARLQEVRHTYADLEIELALFQSEIVRGEPRSLHARALRWMRRDHLASLPFCEADGPFVQALERGDY